MTLRQLTLFVAGSAAVEVERVRTVVDPVQQRLIAAHVTLCREDEIDGLSTADMGSRIADASHGPLTLRFGRPEPFSWHGIVVHCVAGQSEFHALRQRILGTDDIATRTAHITLAHPRNPKAPGNSLAIAATLPDEMTFVFDAVSLIEQEDRSPWRVLEPFALVERTRAQCTDFELRTD